MQAFVTPESKAAWDAAAKRYGVSLSALIEALGPLVAAGGTINVKRLVEDARAIDAERRQRGAKDD